MKNSLVARVTRLEQQRNPLPSLILGFRRGAETDDEARTRIFAEHGLSDRAVVSFALMEEFDQDL